MIKSNFDILLEKLDGFIRKYYKNQLLKGLILSVGIVVVYFLTITLLEYFVRFDSGIRMFLFYSFLATTAYVFVTMIFIPIFKIFSFGKLISYEQAANIIGRHFDVVDDKILNTIQLNQLSDLSRDNELIVASVSQKIDEIKSVNFTLAIDFSENRKYLGYALAPVLLLLLIAFGAPNIISNSSERLLLHNESFVPPAPFKFIILNEDDLVGVQQDDFELEIKIEGTEIPQEVYIEYQDHQFKLNAKNKTHYSYTFNRIQQDIEFNFYANEVRSEDYLLKVHPNPTVLDFTVNLIYPKYINKNNNLLKNIGDLTVPVG
ncbi:MAG: DUF4175 domain-containing protein, partial [Bacteroidetes bacterium]|nr:DUF4175 domain-containing protein [Bacteroidota bacterium]